MAGKGETTKNKGSKPKKEWPRASPNSTLPPAPSSLPPKPPKPSFRFQPPTMAPARDPAGGDSGSDDMDLASNDSGPASSPIVQARSTQPAISTSGISNQQPTTNNNNMDSNDNKGKVKAKDPLEVMLEEAAGTSKSEASAAARPKMSSESTHSQPKEQAIDPVQKIFQNTGTTDAKSLSDKILANLRLRAAEKEAQESISKAQTNPPQKATSDKTSISTSSSSSETRPSAPAKPSSSTHAPVASPKLPTAKLQPTQTIPGLTNWVGTNTGARSFDELAKIIEARANQPPPPPTLFEIEMYMSSQTNSRIQSERAKDTEIERKKQASRDLNHHFTDGRKIDHLFENSSGGVAEFREKTALEVVENYQKAQAELRDLSIKNKTAAQNREVIEEEQRREKSHTLEPGSENGNGDGNDRDQDQDQAIVMGNTSTGFFNMEQQATASSSTGPKATSTTNPRPNTNKAGNQQAKEAQNAAYTNPYQDYDEAYERNLAEIETGPMCECNRYPYQHELVSCQNTNRNKPSSKISDDARRENKEYRDALAKYPWMRRS